MAKKDVLVLRARAAHAEERAAEVHHFECEPEQAEDHGREGGSAGAEDEAGTGVATDAVVRVDAQVTVA